MSENFVTSKEAARLAGISVQRINVLINTGRISAHKFGRDWAVYVTSLIAWKECADEHRTGIHRTQRS